MHHPFLFAKIFIPITGSKEAQNMKGDELKKALDSYSFLFLWQFFPGGDVLENNR